MARQTSLAGVRRLSVTAIAAAAVILLAACGAPPGDGAVASAAEPLTPDNGVPGCGPQSVQWPTESDPGWRARVPDAPLPAGFTVPAVERVGRIDGEAGAVQGAASYDVPLFVPPGRAGMEPALALRYTSSRNGDLAGVGWTMTGASRIHRCPRTQEHDGQVAPVGFTPQDRLCLDGQRLVAVSGAYGSVNAEYRTEIDSFARITQLGALDDPRTCFRMEEKGGRVVTFGGCQDHGAVEIPPGQIRPWAWAEERVADPRGNEMKYDYTVEDGQHLLRTIHYTGFAGARGNRRVELEYEPRPDVEIAYHAQGQVRSVRRLRAVTSYHTSAVARRYQLEYAASPATGRSLLQALRMCAAARCDDANSLPRTVFGYQGAAASWVAAQVPATDPERERFQLVADYDGDGERDLLRKVWQHPWGSSGTPTFLELSSGTSVDLASLPMVFDHASSNAFNAPDLDFDADGRADLRGTLGGAFAVASWNPSRRAFQAKGSNLPLPAGAFSDIQVADFNADGRMDVLTVSQAPFQLTVHLQCPSSPQGQIQFCASHVLSVSIIDCERILRVSDFDGNGYPDLLFDDDPDQPGIVAGGSCPGQPHIVFLRSQNGGLAAADATVGSMSGPTDNITGNPYGALLTLDLNGDELLDFVHLPTSNPAVAWINEGGNQVGTSTKFRREPILGVGPGLAFASLIRNPYLIGVVKTADVDNDGRAEILVPYGVVKAGPNQPWSGVWCYLYVSTIPGEPIEACSEGTEGLTFYNGSTVPHTFDRSIYRWNVVDLDLDAAGRVTATERPSDLKVPIRYSSTPMDHFGDGLEDVQYFIGPAYAAGPAGNWPAGDYANGPARGTWIARHRGPAPDLLTSVVDGVGAQTRFHYAPLSSTGHAQCASPVGQPFYRADHGNFTPDGKRSLFTSSMHVVSRLERENGLGGLNATCFRYANAWVHREGRGFLTFGEITEEEDVPGDAANDLRRTRHFHRDFPYTGLVHEETERLASDPLTAQPIARTSSTWQSSCRTPPGQLARICFPYQATRRAERRDLATRAVVGTTNTAHFYYTADVAFGNISLTAVVTSDAQHSQQVTTDYKYDYADAASWWINKLVEKTETFGAIVAAASPAGPAGQSRVVTTYEYGPNRLQKWERIQPGQRDQALSTFTDHDRYGNPTVVRQEAAGAAIRRTTTTYTADGYFPEVTRNPLAHATTVDVNPLHGQPNRSTDPNGNSTVMLYDAFGRRILLDTPDRPPVAERLLGCPAGTCPPRAVLREVTMQAGSPTRTRYLDRLGRPVRQDTTGFGGASELSMAHIQYDARGRKVGESEPTFDPDPANAYYTTWDRHDALGRPGRKKVPQSGWRSPIVYGYTYVGLETQIRLPGVANPVVRTHDSQGRLVRAVDPYGKPTDYRYDPRGNLALIQDALGNQTVMQYDDRGRQLSVDHPDRGRATTTYDGFGQAIATVDARGITVQRRFDVLGRPTGRSVDGSLEAEWGYDRTYLGALDFERGGTAGVGGYCRGVEYDAFGKPLRTVTFANGVALSRGNAYDAQFGRLKAVRSPSGRLLALDYTDHGYLEREGDGALSAQGWSRRITAMTAHGRIRSETFGNGLAGTYQYDPASGRVTSLWLVKPGQPLVTVHSLGYVYDDPLGGLSRQSNYVTDVAETFGYDAVSRLDWATRTWPGGGSETVDYQYDAIGNLVVKGDYSVLTSYGRAGRANPANAGPHAIRSYRMRNGVTVSDFRYDASGNLLAGDGRTAKYDAHDRPVLLEEGGRVVRYAYGPNHERYKRATGAITTYYVDTLYERIVAGASVIQRDYVGDKIVITRLPSGVDEVRYLHPDRLGSVDTITDRTGVVVERQAFDPFGGPRDDQWRSNPTLANPVTDRGFTGHEQVDDVHLIHMGGRVYDYRLGRFLSVDPIVVEPRDMQSLNAYSYVRNNPTGRVDPTGYLERPEWVKRVEGWVTTYLAPSSGRAAAGDSSKGAAGTPAAGATAMKGEQPAKDAPEDTGAPGRSLSREDQNKFMRVLEGDEPVVASVYALGDVAGTSKFDLRLFHVESEIEHVGLVGYDFEKGHAFLGELGAAGGSPTGHVTLLGAGELLYYPATGEHHREQLYLLEKTLTLGKAVFTPELGVGGFTQTTNLSHVGVYGFGGAAWGIKAGPVEIGIAGHVGAGVEFRTRFLFGGLVPSAYHRPRSLLEGYKAAASSER